MTNSKVLFRELISSITLHEEKDEIASIVYLFLESRFNISRTDIIGEKLIDLSEEDKNQIEDFLQRINNHEPIQYILGECEFFGRKFMVNSSVLIPRPETEELVREVLKFCESQTTVMKILDIGTGSGCIPIILGLEMGGEIFGSDISQQALDVATQNAERLGANVTFVHNDILKENITMTEIDIVVSNPPYIAEKEKSLMKENVLRYEPHQALFVSDEDTLLFYKSILTQSKNILKRGGLMAFEINEQFGKEISNLFTENGFSTVQIIKDIFGKERIVTGIN
jgi:release factor glutamine methyltransferase